MIQIMAYYLVGICLGIVDCDSAIYIPRPFNMTLQECDKAKNASDSTSGLTWFCVKVKDDIIKRQMCSIDNKTWWPARSDNLCYLDDKEPAK